jgi:hypothetical protein
MPLENNASAPEELAPPDVPSPAGEEQTPREELSPGEERPPDAYVIAFGVADAANHPQPHSRRPLEAHLFASSPKVIRAKNPGPLPGKALKLFGEAQGENRAPRVEGARGEHLRLR